MQIHFQPEAEAELAEARVWYAQQREGLDDALIQRVEEVLQRIVDSPYAYQVEYRQLRRAVLHQFPFAIFLFAYESGDSGICRLSLQSRSEEVKIADVPRTLTPLTPLLAVDANARLHSPRSKSSNMSEAVA